MSAPPSTPFEELDAIDVPTLRRRRSAKWTAYPDDVIPAWVAEMDFPLAPPIRERLHEVIELGDLGYPAAERCGVREALTAWLARAQGWTVDPDAVLVLPDVMRGVELAILAHTAPGDAIAVPTPVYPPFLSAVRTNGRELVEVPLRRDDTGFHPDLDGIEAAFTAGARMLLLCHPHNPTGHLHDRDELAAIATIAARHGAVVLSDEIHAPLTLDGTPHTPFATVSEAAAACAVTVTSASKAWNIPGLRTAFLICEREALLAPILATPRVHHGCSIAGLEASIAAFSRGEEWLATVLRLLERNRGLLLDAALPGVEIGEPRATYLAWLDCRALELPDGPFAFFLEHARVALSDGMNFGLGGEGWVRLNFATSLGVLEQILDRMAGALADRA
ncbi:MAG: MalY/PatB family protein [Solirubrobacteraceae bacterium]